MRFFAHLPLNKQIVKGLSSQVVECERQKRAAYKQLLRKVRDNEPFFRYRIIALYFNCLCESDLFYLCARVKQ